MNESKLKNIIKLCKKNNVELFHDNYKEKKLKKTNKIIEDCNKKKKKTLKIFSTLIKELAYKPNSDTLKKLKTINRKFEREVQNLDNIIEGVSEEFDKYSNLSSLTENIESKKNYIIQKKNIINYDNFIEFYSN
jgi:uncharacterized protein YoxC